MGERLTNNRYDQEKEVFENFLFFTENKQNIESVASETLKKCGNINNIFNASASTLSLISPLSPKSIELAEITKQLKHKLAMEQLAGIKINSTTDAKSFCKTIYPDFETERFFCICLDKNNKITGYQNLAVGHVSFASFRMRTMIEFVLSSNCKRIIVTHSHPDGSTKFSQNDTLFTNRLVYNCMLNDICLVDHILVTEHEQISMLKNADLENIKLDLYNNTPITDKAHKQYLYLSDNYKI
ncbi:MAG: hypothetical protein IJS68_01875 [Clostridia bacterium]|nr:hypothetical protein [Clostridia bacterium]